MNHVQDESPWRDAEGWWILGEDVPMPDGPVYRKHLYYTNPRRSRSRHLHYNMRDDPRNSDGYVEWYHSHGFVSYKSVKHALRPVFDRNGHPVEKEPHVEKNHRTFQMVYKLVRRSNIPTIANARRMQFHYKADKQLQEQLRAAAHGEDPDADELVGTEHEPVPIGTDMILELEFRCNRPLDGNILARLNKKGKAWGKDLPDSPEIEVCREVAKARLIDTRTGTFVPGWVPYNNTSDIYVDRGHGTDRVKIAVPRFVAWTGEWWRLVISSDQSSLNYEFLGLDGRDTIHYYSYSMLPPVRYRTGPATIVPDDLFTYDQERRMEKLSIADAALAMIFLQKRQRGAAEAMYEPGGAMAERLKDNWSGMVEGEVAEANKRREEEEQARREFEIARERAARNGEPLPPPFLNQRSRSRSRSSLPEDACFAGGVPNLARLRL